MSVQLTHQVNCIFIPTLQLVPNGRDPLILNNGNDVMEDSSNLTHNNQEETRVVRRPRELLFRSSTNNNDSNSSVSREHGTHPSSTSSSRKRKNATSSTGNTTGSGEVQRYYCPYKQCDVSSFREMRLLFQHIQRFHDFRFPAYDSRFASSIIRTPYCGTIDLTDPDNKIVKPGMSLIISGPELEYYQCPYKTCIWEVTAPGLLITHLRDNHDIPIPKKLKKKYSLYSINTGKLIEFSRDPNKGKILDEDDSFQLVFHDGKRPLTLLSPLARESSSGLPSMTTPESSSANVPTISQYQQLMVANNNDHRVPTMNNSDNRYDGTEIDDEAIALPPTNPRGIIVTSQSHCTGENNSTTSLSVPPPPSAPSSSASLPRGGTKLLCLRAAILCPYMDCSWATGKRSLSKMVNHIRGKHDLLFPRVQYHRKFSLKNQDGKLIQFDGHDQLDPTQRVIVEYDAHDTKTRCFCPYKNCSVTNKKLYTMLNHIHDFHDPSFIETGVTENGLIRTTRGRRVDFSYEKRATLEEGERLVVDSTGDRRDTDYCYCPYKDCRSSFTLSVRLYLHIRNVHDRKFPLIKSRQERALMTMSGEKVDITANPQRKRFDAGEKLTIVYKHVIHPNQAGYRCPYYGCIRASNIRSRLFPHIREMHDPSFPVINRAHGNYIFKSGLTKREIDFKEQFMRRFDKIKVVYSNN